MKLTTFPPTAQRPGRLPFPAYPPLPSTHGQSLSKSWEVRILNISGVGSPLPTPTLCLTMATFLSCLNSGVSPALNSIQAHLCPTTLHTAARKLSLKCPSDHATTCYNGFPLWPRWSPKVLSKPTRPCFTCPCLLLQLPPSHLSPDPATLPISSLLHAFPRHTSLILPGNPLNLAGHFLQEAFSGNLHRPGFGPYPWQQSDD